MEKFNKLYTNLNKIDITKSKIYIYHEFDNEFKNFIDFLNTNKFKIDIYFIPKILNKSVGATSARNIEYINDFINDDFIMKYKNNFINIHLVFDLENVSSSKYKTLFSKYNKYNIYFTIDNNLKIFNDYNIFMKNVKFTLYYDYYIV